MKYILKLFKAEEPLPLILHFEFDSKEYEYPDHISLAMQIAADASGLIAEAIECNPPKENHQ